jgi:hypothetical protein
LGDGVGEQSLSKKDVGILGEEAKDDPRHKVIHIVATRGRTPFGIVLEQLDIQTVEAAGGSNVKSVFSDLLDCRNTGKRQENTKMVGEVLVGAGDSFAAAEVLSLEVRTVCRQDEFSFRFGGRGLSLRAVSAFASSPVAQIAMWILLV